MDKIVKYLKGNVLGKALITDELIYQLENGKLEGVYSDQITFSNLYVAEAGMHFDMFVNAQEKVYELNENHERTALTRDYNGGSVFRYELAKRKSSGQVTGIMRLISTIVKNQTAEAIVCGVYDIKVENNELSWKEQQLLYRDQASNDGKHRPVAFDSQSRFYFEGNKLRYEYNGTCYDVDPISFAKTPSKDIFPKFLAQEK